VNALANERVAEYVNDHFIATYLKVGTFRIVGGQKVGGNVASYFCLPDGGVVHAIAGPVNAEVFLTEARWALETRKLALTLGTRLATGEVEQGKYEAQVRLAHVERFQAEGGTVRMQPPILAGARGKQAKGPILPAALPQRLSRSAQVHWLLATNPLTPIDAVYPIVWEDILGERLSGLPVALR
jgi:hypothetical protein